MAGVDGANKNAGGANGANNAGGADKPADNGEAALAAERAANRAQMNKDQLETEKMQAFTRALSNRAAISSLSHKFSMKAISDMKQA